MLFHRRVLYKVLNQGGALSDKTQTILRTLGKFFQGLVVRKLDGNPRDWTGPLIRGTLRIFEVNPLLLGGLPAGLVIIASQRKQRIGNLLAGTVVVSNKVIYESSSTVPTPEQAIAE